MTTKNPTTNTQTIYAPQTKFEQLATQQSIEHKQRYHSSLKSATRYYQSHRWWLLDNKIILDSKTGYFWYISEAMLMQCDALEFCQNLKFSYLSDWALPLRNEVTSILSEKQKRFPLLTGKNFELSNTKLLQTAEGTIWLNHRYPKTTDDTLALVLPVNRSLENETPENIFFRIFNTYKWSARPYALPENTKDESFNNFLRNIKMVVKYLYNSFEKQSVTQETTILLWKNIDYISTRLPKLDELRFTDINQGMWEFYTADGQTDNRIEVSNRDAIRPRNPELDIKNAKVAIDFGTSSTVVAIRQDGKDELLRIGLQEVDMQKNEIKENDFENPTVLEFLNIPDLLEAWHSEAYRPLVNWDTVHCSHEARHRFRQNDTDPVIVGSILSRIKQWALRDSQQAKARITDSSNRYEYEFEHLAELLPIKGQALTISEDYPELDPIELYAWFLGMNINWRDRGIFLKYYMTFPVAYPVDVKHKILASFRRGLQRSLPDGLLYSDRFSEFSVEELASEPSAFSASALRTLKIEPTEAGVAYAVFDFGGGTTDFDYGIYRLPDDDEYEEGWDDVLEHFGSSGDKFLGGENILENMAYLVYKHNQNVCREKNITFTKPLDADNFVGSERLISSTQASITNSSIMMSKLRPIWESAEIEGNASSVLKLRLLNRNGKHADCEFSLPLQKLYDYLYQRIQAGLINFFTAMKSSFENRLDKLPEEIHILLAGNSSRSHIVQSILGMKENKVSNYITANFANEIKAIFGVEDENVMIEGNIPVDFKINSFVMSDDKKVNVNESIDFEGKGILTIKEDGNYIFTVDAKYQNESLDFKSELILVDKEGKAYPYSLHIRHEFDIQAFIGNNITCLDEFDIQAVIGNITCLPKFNIHLPLQSDVDNPYQPNTKTGVALGLLKISPGESLKVVNHEQSANTDSPFQFYVGNYRRDIFQPALHRGGDYGAWQELGRVRQGVFILAYTTQAQALNDVERGSHGLKEMPIEFAGENTKGKRVFGKIISPDSIDICLAPSLEEIEQASDRREIKLIF